MFDTVCQVITTVLSIGAGCVLSAVFAHASLNGGMSAFSAFTCSFMAMALGIVTVPFRIDPFDGIIAVSALSALSFGVSYLVETRLMQARAFRKDELMRRRRRVERQRS